MIIVIIGIVLLVLGIVGLVYSACDDFSIVALFVISMFIFIFWMVFYIDSCSFAMGYKGYKSTVEEQYKNNYSSAMILKDVAKKNEQIAMYKGVRKNIFISWFVCSSASKLEYIKMPGTKDK